MNDTARSPYRVATPPETEREIVHLCQGCCHERHAGRCAECGQLCLSWQMQRFIDPSGTHRRVHRALVAIALVTYLVAWFARQPTVAAVAFALYIVLASMLLPRLDAWEWPRARLPGRARHSAPELSASPPPRPTAPGSASHP